MGAGLDRHDASKYVRGSRPFPRPPALPSLQLEAVARDDDPARALVGVVRLVHRLDVVEPADQVRRPEAVARLDVAAVKLLNEADVAALVAPRLACLGRVERHAGQPRAGLAVELHLIRADHACGYLPVVALVQELRVGAEVLLELAGRDRLVA